MKRLSISLLLLLLGLLIPGGLRAQGVFYHDVVWKFSPGGTFPASGATITVCPSTSSGVPCAPVAAVYLDKGLTLPCTGLNIGCLTADSKGNFGFYAPSGDYIYTVSGVGITPYGPIPFTLGTSTAGFLASNNNFTGTNSFQSINGHFWAGPGATPTIDTAVAAAVAAGGGIVDIHSAYSGAESSTCANIDGITEANVSSLVTVVDWRNGSSACGYQIAINSAQQGAKYTASSFRFSTSPTTTESAVLGTYTWKGVTPGSLSLASGTFQCGSTSAITTPTGLEFIQCINGQAAIRSTGGTLLQVMGVAGGGGIDRGPTTTNITQFSSLYGFDCKNSSSSGATIRDCFGVLGAAPTLATNNNYSFFSQGNSLWATNTGIDVLASAYVLPTTPTGLKLLRFDGSNNLPTAGVNQYSTLYAGVPYKFFPSGHCSWLIGPNVNISEAFEITASTVCPNGTSFTTPIFRVNSSSVSSGPSAQVTGDFWLSGVVKNSALTATMGLTLKKGSGAGNYTTASTTYVVPDSTNLCYTVTIPVGWKLGVQASGSIGTSTAIVAASAALTDNAACSTANAGLLTEAQVDAGAIGATAGFSLSWVITGDGAAHNVALQIKTANGADSALLLNSSATALPTMTFTLMPSN